MLKGSERCKIGKKKGIKDVGTERERKRGRNIEAAIWHNWLAFGLERR